MPKTKLKYIYWFAYYNLDAPSVRYRALYPLQFGEDTFGIDYCLIIPGYRLKRISKFVWAYFSILLFPKKDSLVVIQRVHSNFIYSSLLKLLVRCRKSRCIYDLDDADYLEFKTTSIHFFAKHCAAITAGSIEIAKYMKQFNANIHLSTSPILDLNLIKQQKNERLVIGWIGGFGGGHKASLYELVFPAIKALNFEVELLILGVYKNEDEQELIQYFSGSQHVQLTLPLSIDWQDEKGIQQLICNVDVGIATLQNDPLQLAKSGIKAKQYMNNGVPVLANNLPENNTVVEDGKNGFFCDTPEEFQNRLTEFHNMTEDEYSEFSSSARNSISNFDHNYYFEVLNKVYSSLKADK